MTLLVENVMATNLITYTAVPLMKGLFRSISHLVSYKAFL